MESILSALPSVDSRSIQTSRNAYSLRYNTFVEGMSRSLFVDPFARYVYGYVYRMLWIIFVE